MADIQLREPESFAAGDTLLFEKDFPRYPASQGWSLTYVLTDLAGNEKLNVQSAADGDLHKIDVDGYAKGLPAGDYIFSGYAINGAERHCIYQAVLTLGDDLADGLASGSQQTEAEQMIATIKTTLLSLYQRMTVEQDIQRSRFMLQDITKMRGELAYWKEVRANEIQHARAAAGLPPGNVSIPVFNIG